ncbi:MAG: ATP synthase F1 subunit epsilon [Oscillospiraceae bacterium]|nr:ATP synthase F1 subunit epsilon [Oscillospiraceae bacterium]
MASKKLSVRVATPEDVKFDEETEMVIMRCITGDMGILYGHQPISAILDFGVLRLIDGDTERRMAVFGGIAQVNDNTVTILANDAQWPEDIDVAFVKAEHERMARRSQENLDVLEIQRDQVLMRRTLVQIEVSSYPLLTKGELSDKMPSDG